MEAEKIAKTLSTVGKYWPTMAEELREYIATQAAEIEALKLNDARYRWLRDVSNLCAGANSGIALACGTWVKSVRDRKELDTAIDAAIAARQAVGGDR